MNSMKTLDDRVLRTVNNFVRRLREDMDELFGSPATDISAPATWLVQQVLGRGELYQLPTTLRHVVIRLEWSGVALDCDLYAELRGHSDRIQTEYVGALHDDSLPFSQARLTETELDLLMLAVKKSGPKSYADMVPALMQMRKQIRTERSTLA
jgi:hypothetical protein